MKETCHLQLTWINIDSKFAVRKHNIMILLKIGLLGAGVVCHDYYFQIGEHHLYSIRYLQTFLAVSLISVAILAANGSSVSSAASTLIPYIGSWLVGLYASLIFYRILLSPLNRFPGPHRPFGARISSLWLSAQLWRLDAHKRLLVLH